MCADGVRRSAQIILVSYLFSLILLGCPALGLKLFANNNNFWGSNSFVRSVSGCKQIHDLYDVILEVPIHG